MTYFLDLFAGIGGFALGARWAGLKFNKHYFSEVDKYAIEVYKKRFPGAVNLGDINRVGFEDLPGGRWLVAGGFPCQDISVAGRGAGLSGSRSSLWFAMQRVIRNLRPDFVVIENVGALVRQGLETVLFTLAQIGYDAEWQDIRASDVGAPHKRERIWIVAYPCKQERREDSGATLTRKEVADSENADRWRADGEDNHRWGYQEARGCRVERRGVQHWGSESGIRRVAHGVPSRVHRLKCLGNAVVPQIPELLFRRIKDLWVDAS